MRDRTFLDTNVLVYAFDSSDVEKQRRSWAILDEAGREGSIVLSTQVLQEFFVAVTRKLSIPLPEKEAEQATVHFSMFPVVRVDVPMILGAVGLSRRMRLSFWDSLILEAAREGGCRELLSEDFQDGLEVGPLRVRNPYRD